MELGLTDKVVIITGAGRNIGRGVALAFAREGARVVVADIDGEAAGKVVGEIEARGGQAMAVAAAVQDQPPVRAMVDAVLARFGRIDVLVNNAAINSKATTQELTLERWRDTLEVNLTGAFNCSQAVMGHMMERRSGRIINVSSVNAFNPMFSDAAYVTTKAGIVGLTRRLMRDLAPYGVTCNAVAPSMVADTDMSRATLQRTSLADMLARFPLGRACTIEDVANTVLFLASEAASFITGQVIHVNGGAYM